MTTNAPTTFAEIAKATEKNQATIARLAKSGKGWPYTEAASHSRHKRRMFALNDLPISIRDAVMAARGSAAINAEPAVATNGSNGGASGQAIQLRLNMAPGSRVAVSQADGDIVISIELGSRHVSA